MKKNILFFVAILWYPASKAFAQADSSGVSAYEQSIQNAIESYHKAIGENNHLYNGSEYVTGNYQPENNPYYASIFSGNGSILYDELLFNDVPLTYDIFHDEVIIDRYNQHYKIRLVSEKIDHFDFAGHTFIRIVEDSSNKVLLGTGFYDRLYNNKLMVLAKRRKKVVETIELTGATSQFTEDDHYFINKNGEWNEVHNRASVLRVLKDKRKDVVKLMRKNKIKFKNNFENATVKAAEYYDQIKN